MKTLFIPLFLSLFLVSHLPTCQKGNDSFCIKNIKASTTATVGELTIDLPNGESYSGQGALPFSTRIRNYQGQMSSVITAQTQTESGVELEVVHLFDDGKGNAFWTNDHATLTPLNEIFTRFQVYNEMTVVGGTGDFECATGNLVNQGAIDFVTSKLDINMTGTVCGGCD